MPETTVEIFSDGACSGNPVPEVTVRFSVGTEKKRSLAAAKSIPPITVWSSPELSRR